jgi:hypothetical protein
MKWIINNILPWLLHQANRESKEPQFYAIKKRILEKYGEHDGYDLQTIPGKRCWSCKGTGIYEHWRGNEWCYHCCGNGWYKDPLWNILERVKFGHYTFHQPHLTVHNKPDGLVKSIIEGYIIKPRAKHGEFALFVLFMLYDRKNLSAFLRKYAYWSYRWYWPKNWLRTATHLAIYGKGNLKSEFSLLIWKLRNKLGIQKKAVKSQLYTETDDLPF